MDLETETFVDRICAYVGLGEGVYSIEISRDGDRWDPAMRIEQKSIYGMVEWRAARVDARARYVRLTAEEPGLQIGELGLFGSDGSLLVPSVRASPGFGMDDPKRLVDEQRAAARTPTFLNSMYFDETYFARTAWEYVIGAEPSETTHPPLGKLMIAAGVLLFGMTPFGWRFMPALFGTLAVPLFYFFARRLLKRSRYALLAALLFAFDFMRFVECRMATVDTFVVFFVLCAFFCAHSFWSRDEGSPRETRAWLRMVAAGASLGAAASCKWVGLYAAIGVDVLFIAFAMRRAASWMRARAARQAFPAASERLLSLGAASLLVVPVTVYAASYLPDILRYGRSIADVFAQQVAMFKYHSSVTETRWYASPWWAWPLITRPIWLYAGRFDLPAGAISSIILMGNPALWWAGAAALPLTAAVGWWKRDRAATIVLVAFLSLFLPWAISPRRLQFVYHFFPCVPFMILALSLLLKGAMEWKQWARFAVLTYVAVVVVLFGLFFPVLTGIPIPRTYAEVLHWFRSWVLFSP